MSETKQREVAAWRISAEKGCKYFLENEDPRFLFSSIRPGDALLLMDATGDNAWGVRRSRPVQCHNYP